MTRAVLFDLDGTLLDSIELILASYRHTLGAAGISRTDAEVIALLGMPLEECFAVLAPGLPVAPLVAGYREHNLAAHDGMVRPYPGVTELVHGLRRAGRPLAIVTSKRRLETERGLGRLGLEGVFDVLVCAGDAERPKPDGAPVRLALEKLGAPATEAFFVGDSPHDVAAGRRAGVRTVGVLWGPFARATLEAERPTVLVEDAAALDAALR